MSRTFRLATAAAFGLLLTVATALVAAESNAKKVKYEDLPQPVQITVDAKTSGSKVWEYTMETVEGQTLYRVHLLRLQRPRVITIAADGALVSIDDRITWESIPAGVQEALLAQARPGSLGEFHTISKDGKILAYSAVVDNQGDRHRISVNPEAAVLEAVPSASASPTTDEK
jgi:hypothetical protein